MEKETLIKLSEKLYQEAFSANQYYLIMLQYRKIQLEYRDELSLSPAFNSVVYEALQKACFMELAKLYDKTQNAVSVGVLLKDCKENIALFPKYREVLTVNSDDGTQNIQIPYQHRLKPEEECFFRGKVESQRKIFEIFDMDITTPVTVEFTFSEFLELYQKRFCALSKKQENIRQQRNKIYAHNDKEKLFDIDSFIQKNPVYYSDIKELIDFALDSIGLILGILTGVCKAVKYGNIDDFENTLSLARLGLKYQDYEMQQKEQEFKARLYEKKQFQQQ